MPKSYALCYIRKMIELNKLAEKVRKYLLK